MEDIFEVMELNKESCLFKVQWYFQNHHDLKKTWHDVGVCLELWFTI